MAEPAEPIKAHNVRRRWVLGLWLANLLAIVTTAVAAAMDVESIVGTGPALTLVGLALAFAARPFRSWLITGFALSGPLVCTVVAGLIGSFQLDPADAQQPIPILLAIYALAAIPASLFALRSILRTSPRDASRSELTWRFSLRSLLLLTTAVCVLVAVGRAVLANNVDSEYGIFGLFNLVTLTFVGLTVYSYVRKS